MSKAFYVLTVEFGVKVLLDNSCQLQPSSMFSCTISHVKFGFRDILRIFSSVFSTFFKSSQVARVL